MLTVRTIGPDLSERVFPVEFVDYIPETNVTNSYLRFAVSGGGSDRLDHGRCFVMNAAGKTVARYELGDQSPFLHREPS